MKYFRLALSFLTIIPIGTGKEVSASTWAKSIVFYPICGYIIVTVAVLPVFLLNYFLNTNPLLLAGITVSLLALITGALHLDGFADVCDGFWCPTGSKERRLEIMHDSRVGTYGSVGLILLLLLKFTTLYVILKNGEFLEVAAIIILARFFIIFLAMISKHPPEDGPGKFVVGKISRKTIILATLFILPCLFSLKMIIVAVILLIIIFLLKTLSDKLIGGVTGDVLGAYSELCEVSGFLILAISLGHV